MAYFRRAGLYRTADIKPVFPDARLNRFKGIFYPFVIHGAHCPFAPMSNNTDPHHPIHGSDKLRWRKWLGQKNAIRNALRGPPVGCSGDVEDGKGRVDLSGPLRDLPSIQPAQQSDVGHERVLFALVSL